MKGTLFKSILYSAIFVLVLLPPLWHFNSHLIDIKKEKEIEILYQKLLTEAWLKEEEEKQKLYLTGRFDPAKRDDFVVVPLEYTLYGSKVYLKKETYAVWRAMEAKAQEDGISLKITSGARNFDYQKTLWDNKWSGVTKVEGKNLTKSIPDGLLRFKKILAYSAAPSTSRHHWGTEIDINDVNPEYFNQRKGIEEYAWLVENAPKFGFCQTYNMKEDTGHATGYDEEKWHWSYLPLARGFTKNYKELVTEQDIFGFEGEEYVAEQDLINDYVLSINPECL